MSLIQLIARVLGLNEKKPAVAAVPMIERVETRQLMAFTGGVYVAAGDVNGDGAAITDGTSNTILYAEKTTKAPGTRQVYLQVKLEDVLISSYQ